MAGASPLHPPETSSPVMASYREQLRRRRTSSLSSNNDRSPVSLRSSRQRFSNASLDSFTALGDHGTGGMGNLADELDQLSDEVDNSQDYEELPLQGDEDSLRPDNDAVADKLQSSSDGGARDSGIDVSYEQRRSKLTLDAPTCEAERQNQVCEAELVDDHRLSPELDDLINTVARMAAATPAVTSAATSDDPLIPRTIALLQDLGNQSALEAGAHRLTTSTNSMAANLSTQTRAVQSLAASLYSPFGAAWARLSTDSMADPEALGDAIAAAETLLAHLPHADTAPLQGLQRLQRDAGAASDALAHLADSLQMGKQLTNAASRHLRATEAVVVQLRRERDAADAAQADLDAAPWSARFRDRWCRSECDDIMAGFTRKCDSLREGLVRAAGGTAAVAS